MSIFTAILNRIEYIFNEVKEEAETFISDITPGIKAAARQAIKVFGQEAIPTLEKFASDVLAAVKSREAGVSVGSIIVPLVETLSSTLAPALIEEGENVLYTMGNLAISEFFDEVSNNEISDTQTQIGVQASGVQTEPKAEEGQAS